MRLWRHVWGLLRKSGLLFLGLAWAQHQQLPGRPWYAEPAEPMVLNQCLPSHPATIPEGVAEWACCVMGSGLGT